jgi:hypothetical protein
MKNELALLALRPDLSHLSVANSNAAEVFQNLTIRPILKMQHDLLLLLTRHFPHFNTIAYTAKSEEEYKAAVIEFLKNQIALKNQIIGLIIGHFTSDEWSAYSLDKNEYNKRMINMAGERVAGACWPDLK